MKINRIQLLPEIDERFNKLYGDSAPIFNTYNWLKNFSPNLRLYGIFDDGNNLIGDFFLYREVRFGFNFYRNPPFTPMIGPFLKIDAKNPVAIMSKWREALSLMANFFDKLDYAVISVSLARDIVDTLPFIWKKFKVIPAYTYIIDLNDSTDVICKRMSPERRNDINKGIKDGLIVKKIDDMRIIKSLVLNTFARQEKKTNEYYLDKVLFNFANEENSFAFTTYKDNHTITCTFCINDKVTSYYLLGGYDQYNKHHGAGPLSIWEAIKYSKLIGLKYFDFEGSIVPQIERYFRGFGGQLTPYYRINKARLPLEILLKFYKRELF